MVGQATGKITRKRDGERERGGVKVLFWLPVFHLETTKPLSSIVCEGGVKGGVAGDC